MPRRDGGHVERADLRALPGANLGDGSEAEPAHEAARATWNEKRRLVPEGTERGHVEVIAVKMGDEHRIRRRGAQV